MNDDLPPLPEPYGWFDIRGEAADGFTADQMRAYAAAAVAREREKAAAMLTMYRAQASLAYGEMSAQEWRTLSAVLTERAAAIRSPD